ncbi:MAG: hypothetical protein A2X56_00265 [Nitrospirae bacterium GWC2_57_13]|nr:MAG: hypothetical protein A2072_08690 [Nitrospirae bacterium GWC1_57_7]OGW28489.1 MAG: hypothetical protein A2X56_00265 [Nitrospirae bacterium GWC2_57_13]OGW46016.1 MAG: hypothetical protein A2X57_10105 [Nitrospirae bacterium GWD2_57_8]
MLVLIIGASILIVGIAYAGVSGSKHDFSIGGTSGFQADTETEVCIFCHTPHGASDVPLWNKTTNSTGYTMYNSTVSSTLDATVPTAPTGVSLLCMSCHDGVSAINVVVNYGPNGPISMPAASDQLGDLSYPPSRNPNLTKDLSNDHPVSFIFDTNLITLDAAGGPAQLKLPVAPLKLFVGKLECATCHDPHEEGKSTGTTPFLRMSNAGSDMCLTCHIK